jgi:hypothetical protein
MPPLLTRGTSPRASPDPLVIPAKRRAERSSEGRCAWVPAYSRKRAVAHSRRRDDGLTLARLVHAPSGHAIMIRPRRCGGRSGTAATDWSRGPRSDRSIGRGRQTSGSPCAGARSRQSRALDAALARKVNRRRAALFLRFFATPRATFAAGTKLRQHDDGRLAGCEPAGRRAGTSVVVVVPGVVMVAMMMPVMAMPAMLVPSVMVAVMPVPPAMMMTALRVNRRHQPLLRGGGRGRGRRERCRTGGQTAGTEHRQSGCSCEKSHVCPPEVTKLRRYRDDCLPRCHAGLRS